MTADTNADAMQAESVRIASAAPAYPIDNKYGLTKRELIAAMAMQGMLAHPEPWGSTTTYAKNAVQYADALLQGLAK